jgi:hypothetical protein
MKSTVVLRIWQKRAQDLKTIHNCHLNELTSSNCQTGVLARRESS